MPVCFNPRPSYPRYSHIWMNQHDHNHSSSPHFKTSIFFFGKSLTEGLPLIFSGHGLLLSACANLALAFCTPSLVLLSHGY